MTRRPSIGVALLALIGSMLMVVLASTTDEHTGDDISQPAARVIAYRLLSFTDQLDGSVNVIDVSDHSTLAVVKSGEGAFMRGVLRTLTAERRTGGHDRAVPFELRVDAANRLLLIDKATGREILLNAFGPENAAYFKKFLAINPSSRPPVS